MDPLRLKWPEFKAFVDARAANIQEVVVGDRYYLYAFDGKVAVMCRLRKDDPDHTSTEDYEDNYQASANDRVDRPFANDGGFKARHVGYTGTATKTTTTDIDYAVTAERYITGLELIVKDHVFGDTCVMQVVDKDNIFGYGAGTVLNQFGTDWNMRSDTQAQGQLMHNFYARVYAGLYIRLKYTSVGTVNNVSVACNMFLYEKT